MLNKSFGCQGIYVTHLTLELQLTKVTVASMNKETPNTAQNTVVKFIIYFDLDFEVWPYLEIESWCFFFIFRVVVIYFLKLRFQLFNWILFLIYTSWLQVIPVNNISCGTK